MAKSARKTPATAKVTVSNRQRRVRVPAARLRRLLARAARAEGRKLAAVDVAVVGAAEMARLHRLWLARRGPTDVLSFDLSDGPRAPLSAQIVVCADVAADEASAHGSTPTRELLLYALHGLLHLTGHDDARPADAARMQARADELLALARP